VPKVDLNILIAAHVAVGERLHEANELIFFHVSQSARLSSAYAGNVLQAQFAAVRAHAVLLHDGETVTPRRSESVPYRRALRALQG